MENDLSVLVGKTIKTIDQTIDSLTFTMLDGSRYGLYHLQDCCESVQINDIVGELSDLIDSPILKAEERTSQQNPEGVAIPDYQESYTWTFYQFATIKGYVDIRFYGESNGYYSESVTFSEL
jgi:hypothetical protein